MKKLTKAEEEIMLILWELNKGFLKDIVAQFDDPKPHSNTISTILKLLNKKGYVDYEIIGRQHQYFPLVTKGDYSAKSLKEMVANYFNGSYKNVVSFLMDKENLSKSDIEFLLKETDDDE